MGYDNRRILVISDTHYPFSHPDTMPFLVALNNKYSFTRIIHIGDEVDLHSVSFHEHDPDLPGPGHELQLAIEQLLPLYRLFPVVDVLESNHGALFKRKVKASGLPERILKSSRDILMAPKGWNWHEELLVRLPNGLDVMFFHSKGTDSVKISKQLGMCTVNGHHHTQFSINKWATPNGTKWAMVVGCLIDITQRAYSYQRNAILKPVIGCGVIVDSVPKLELMPLDKSGRWTGKLSKW